MRMRKKKNLDERLAQAGDLLLIEDIADRNYKTAVLDKHYINFDEWFARSAPLFIEIGCGKGKFAVEYAKRHPDINFIAVEKSKNVIISGCEQAKAEGISNIRFIASGAEYLERFVREKSISGIFLNFSCPFPKTKYASHRLTNHTFLEIYKRILKDGAEIHQKTDNMQLFEFSIEQFSACGFRLKNISLDLKNSNFQDNIETEYEHRFVSLGKPIYRLEAYL